jgi:hypothetical protein
MLRGHFWTVGPFLRAVLRPPRPPISRHFRAEVADALHGVVRISGRLAEPAGARTLVVLVHGLGGSAESPYMIETAATAHGAGFASLRLNLRGADLSGEDFSHAGLTADLHATLESPDLAPYDSVFVIGFSLGGHLTLRYATEPHDPRVRAVSAICPPLDLAGAARAMDQPIRAPYRRHVLSGLKRIYEEVHRRRGGSARRLDEARAIETLRAWDDQIIAPRHGFANAEDYWNKMSVGPRLDRVGPPALAVIAEADPMIPLGTVRPALEATDRIDVRWVPPARGGHVGFPTNLDLGVDARLGMAPQVLGWLASR